MEKIGIEAVWQDANFRAGWQRYIDSIAKAQAATSQTAAQIAQSGNIISNTWQGVGHVVQTALGFVIGDVVFEGLKRITGLLTDQAAAAYEAVASYERLSYAVTALVARDLSQGQEQIVQQQIRISLTEEEIAKLEALRDAEAALMADIPAAQARLDQMIAAGKTDPRIIAERQQALDALNERLAETQMAIATLAEKEGTLATIEKVVWTNTMSMADALAQAGPAARELLEWIQIKAIKSPFGMQDVGSMFRLAMTYNFTADEARRLTDALVDFGAGTGLTGDAMERIAYALGQINTEGKLTGYTVRQLARAGLPVKNILARSLGITTQALENMLDAGEDIESSGVIEKLITWIEQSFPGAAERAAISWGGLKESIKDLRELTMREFVTPVLEPFRPFVAQLVNTLMSEQFRSRVRSAGEAAGRLFSWGLQGEWRMVLYTLGIPQPVIDSIAGFAATWAQSWGDIKTSASRIWGEIEPLLRPIWDTVGEKLGGLPGLITENMQSARETLTKIETWIGEEKAEGKGLADIGIEIAGRLIGGILEELPTKITGLTDAFSTWASSDETRAAVTGAGEKLGGWVAEGIKGLFAENKETGESIIEAIISSLGYAMSNMQDSIGELGAAFGVAFSAGLIEHFGSKQAADAWRRWWTEAFTREAEAEKKWGGLRGFQEPFIPPGYVDQSRYIAELKRNSADALNDAAAFQLWNDVLKQLEGLPTPSEVDRIMLRANATAGAMEAHWQAHQTGNESEARLWQQVINELQSPEGGPEDPMGYLAEVWRTVARLRQEAADSYAAFQNRAAERGDAEPVVSLWNEHAQRERAVGAELAAIMALPQPGEQVYGLWSRFTGLTEQIGAIFDMGTGSVRGSGKAYVPGYASGLDAVYTRPTYFHGIVAEHAPERVQITPANGGGGGITINIGSIYAPGGDAAAVRRAAGAGVYDGAKRLGYAVRG